MHLFNDKKEENRQKRHMEIMKLQNKSLQLQQDAVEAYKNTMNEFLTIYKNNSLKKNNLSYFCYKCSYY